LCQTFDTRSGLIHGLPPWEEGRGGANNCAVFGPGALLAWNAGPWSEQLLNLPRSSQARWTPIPRAAGTPGPEPEQFYGSPGCPGPDNPNNSSPMPGAARKKGPEAATPRPDSRTNPRFPRKW